MPDHPEPCRNLDDAWGVRRLQKDAGKEGQVRNRQQSGTGVRGPQDGIRKLSRDVELREKQKCVSNPAVAQNVAATGRKARTSGRCVEPKISASPVAPARTLTIAAAANAPKPRSEMPSCGTLRPARTAIESFPSMGHREGLRYKHRIGARHFPDIREISVMKRTGNNACACRPRGRCDVKRGSARCAEPRQPFNRSLI